jgi:hypothetical protein
MLFLKSRNISTKKGDIIYYQVTGLAMQFNQCAQRHAKEEDD